MINRSDSIFMAASYLRRTGVLRFGFCAAVAGFFFAAGLALVLVFAGAGSVSATAPSVAAGICLGCRRELAGSRNGVQSIFLSAWASPIPRPITGTSM